jgi:hypothetical protein
MKVGTAYLMAPQTIQVTSPLPLKWESKPPKFAFSTTNFISTLNTFLALSNNSISIISIGVRPTDSFAGKSCLAISFEVDVKR